MTGGGREAGVDIEAARPTGWAITGAALGAERVAGCDGCTDRGAAAGDAGFFSAGALFRPGLLPGGFEAGSAEAFDSTVEVDGRAEDRVLEAAGCVEAVDTEADRAIAGGASAGPGLGVGAALACRSNSGSISSMVASNAGTREESSAAGPEVPGAGAAGDRELVTAAGLTSGATLVTGAALTSGAALTNGAAGAIGMPGATGIEVTGPAAGATGTAELTGAAEATGTAVVAGAGVGTKDGVATGAGAAMGAPPEPRSAPCASSSSASNVSRGADASSAAWAGGAEGAGIASSAG